MNISAPKRTIRALITGIAGQDGSYLAELLLSKGCYEVFGLARWVDKSDYIPKEVKILEGDLTITESLEKALRIKPDEVYNLAGQSSVKDSFSYPEITGDATGLGAVRLLEACRQTNPMPKFYQAGSSEMFGYAPAPQNEHTPFHPHSPYGCAKVYAHHATVCYRQTYKMFACNGICYNHESQRRGLDFVTQKIARGAAAIKMGKMSNLKLGNLDSQRDWGHAKDYVRAMWLMLQQKRPNDYVIATGITHSVRELAEIAFSKVGLDYERHVVIDPALFRPTDVECLVGDSSKAKRDLGWEPKIDFEEMISEMVAAAMERLS